MNAIFAILALSLGLLLPGCAAMSGVEPTNLSEIKAGTSRQQAEGVLRKPVDTAETALGPAAVYKYDKGGPAAVHPQAAGYFLFMPYLWPFAEHAARKEQEGFLTILYDQRNQVRSAFWYDQLEPLKGIAKGDVETIFELGKRTRPGSDLQFLWYCHAAHKHHVIAQYLLAARFYEIGTEHIGLDLKEAYLWYSLASKDGDESATSRLDQLKSRLDPSDIDNAERLVRSWHPNPPSCKEELTDWQGNAEPLHLLEHLVGMHRP